MAKPLTLSPTARSLFAILDGLLLFLALEGVFYAVADLVWAVLAALLAGYTAARVAHRSPVIHGVITAIPFFLLSAFNLSKGIGDRRTPFVLAYNLLVPLAVILGSGLYSGRKPQPSAPRR